MRLRQLMVLALAFLVSSTVALAGGAPAQHSAPSSPPAPAPASRGGSAPAPRGGSAAAPYHPTGAASGGMNHGGAMSYRGPVSTPKSLTTAGGVQRQVQYVCDNGSGTWVQSSPCPNDGFRPAGSQYSGAEPGSLYIVNFWFIPGSGGAEPGGNNVQGGGVGGIAQGHAAGGQAVAGGRSAAPRTVWMQDPGAARVGMPSTQEQAAFPVQTRLSDTPVSYAVVLRDGTALASVDPPKQSGNMVIGRDRTGRVYSVRAAEVDKAASRMPDAAAPAAAKPKPQP